METIRTIVLALVLIGCSGKSLVEGPNKLRDPKVKKLKPSITTQQDQWSLEKLGLDKAWQNHAASKAVKVMLIGTGVDYNHSDLQENILISKVKGDDDEYIVGKDFVDDDEVAYDHYGHDTALAGIIAGVHNDHGIKGVLPNASLIPVRYIDENGRANILNLVRALNYAAEEKPHVVLLNLVRVKLSQSASAKKIELQSLNEALQNVQKHGVPIIIGAGNNAKVVSVSDPLMEAFTSYQNILIVTSVDANDQRPWLANYSGQYVHTTAPGEEVISTAAGNRYKKVSGTNVAAAHVAAAIAYAEAAHNDSKNYLDDYFPALVSDKAGRELPQLANVVLGRNTLDIAKFLDYLAQ